MAAERKERRLKPKELYKRAFFNQYNFILLAGAGLFAVTTFSWLPLLVGAGVETLWMALGADTSFFHRWADKQARKEAEEALKKQLDEAEQTLDPRTLERFRELRHEAGEIARLAIDNQGMAANLVTKEMGKLGHLLVSFVRLAVARARLGDFLEETSEREIEREIADHTRRLERASDRNLKIGLERSLELAQKRLKQYRSIRSSWEAIGLQSENVEKSFGYLKSCILSSSGVEEFSGELDELINGIDAAEQAYVETDSLIDDLRRTRNANAQRGAIPQR